MKRFSQIAASMVLATSSAAAFAVGGIQIDPTGSGSIAGSIFVPGEIDDSASSVLTKGCMPPGTAAFPRQCVLYAQAYSSSLVGGGRLVWQLVLPVESSSEGGGFAVRLRNSSAPVAAAAYALFYDSASVGGGQTFADTDAELISGLGFGDLGGGALNAGLIEIARGEGHIRTTATDTVGSFVMVDNSFAGSLADKLGDSIGGANIGATDFTAVDTLETTPSLTVHIDIQSQDDNYIVNDLVNADTILDIDALINNAGLTTPYNIGDIVSQNVVNNRADFDGNGFGDNQAGEDNDFACTTAPCDMQFQLSSGTTFNADRVPAPGSLAMLGLGLTAFGVGALRRRKTTIAA